MYTYIHVRVQVYTHSHVSGRVNLYKLKRVHIYIYSTISFATEFRVHIYTNSHISGRASILYQKVHIFIHIPTSNVKRNSMYIFTHIRSFRVQKSVANEPSILYQKPPVITQKSPVLNQKSPVIT